MKLNARDLLPLRLWGGGDSPGACRDLERAWGDHASHARFAEAEVYASMGEGYGNMALMTLAALLPGVGMQLRRGSSTPALILSWSASLPLGPVTACRVAQWSGSLYQLRSLRLVLEPGIVIGSRIGVFARPGLRAIWHRSSWPIGIGAGIGSTLIMFDRQHAAASISPELLLHLGRCCNPGYFMLAVRADRYFPQREPDTVTATFGLAFW